MTAQRMSFATEKESLPTHSVELSLMAAKACMLRTAKGDVMNEFKIKTATVFMENSKYTIYICSDTCVH